jgi:cytidylate kinase
MIITIDGPIATGKSTIAKKLAEAIGFIYFDTGAMYRSLTYALLKESIPLDDREAIDRYLGNFSFDIKIRLGERSYYVGDEDVTAAIRWPEVTHNVSKVAAIPSVREALVKRQREFARGVNAVFEGRDMGTVVFPDAELKIFLTGDPMVRAKRRYEELKTKYPNKYATLTLEQALEDIGRRDYLDTTREVSPLRQAEDSHVIDTTSLSVEQIVQAIEDLIDGASGE